MISLEDSYQDIMNKAMRGAAMTAETLAEQSGVATSDIVAFREGAFSEAVAQKIAPVLGLHPDAYVACGLGAWKPAETAVEGVYQFHNSHGMEPNLYLVFHKESRTAIAFDTGDDASELLAAVETLGCGLTAILITHTHRDHIAALGSIQLKNPTAHLYVGELEPIQSAELVVDGQELNFGGLTIECRLTTGHSVGGITYVISGLERPVAVVGDAMFAGSMGGGMISWADALRTNREKIFTLPDETLLCPGHGPLTTVGEEKRHNPFYPEFK